MRPLKRFETFRLGARGEGADCKSSQKNGDEAKAGTHEFRDCNRGAKLKLTAPQKGMGDNKSSSDFRRPKFFKKFAP